MECHVEVLGSCGAWPEAGRACSGFVIDHDGFRIVMDLGYGTLPRLLKVLGSSTGEGIDAVVITHPHADHMLDLHGLFRARNLGCADPSPIPLYAPRAVLERVAALEDEHASAIERVFDWYDLPAPTYEVGPFRMTSWPLPHLVPDVGVRLASASVCVAYTGDTGPSPALVELGREADLFIVEATDRGQQPGVAVPASDRLHHLSARQAGQVAEAAGARRLLLTHFWPGNDRARSRTEAAEHFRGEVFAAEEGMSLAVARASST